MADAFLLPEDVRPEHARQVLDFLNQAENAQVIADAVEFPNELDVGIRIAQRILNRRNELNGLRTLDQLYAVPYVGPERFTEIVVSLSGAKPPRQAAAGVTPADLDELRRSVDALRAQLQPSVQARLWSLQGTMWLGQSATLLVQVSAGDGRPLIDQPITITTSWGELDAQNVTQSFSGNTTLTRTNDVGLAQLQLRSRFQAPLSDAQRLALELAAGRLPLAAPWPTAATNELHELVQRYRAPASSDLREAIDATFREYGASLAQATHRGQALAQWEQLPVSIVCFVHDDGDERGQRHLTLATHTLIVRNWLPAFLVSFEAAAANDTDLTAQLKLAPGARNNATDLLNDVFISVQSFVNTEQGELGKSIRNRATQAQLQQFLQTNIADVAVEARLDAVSGVHGASKTIGDGGLTLFTAVDANRRDSKTRFDVDLGGLTGRLSTLERSAVTTQQLDSQLNQALALKADRASVDALALSNSSLRQDLDAVRGNTIGLRGELTSLAVSVDGLNTRVTRDLSTVGTRIDRIDVITRGGD